MCFRRALAEEETRPVAPPIQGELTNISNMSRDFYLLY
jgi:hypothetical protein